MLGKTVIGEIMLAKLEFVYNNDAYTLSLDWTREDFVNAGALGLAATASVVRQNGERAEVSLAILVTPDDEGALWITATLEPMVGEILRMPVSELFEGRGPISQILDRIPVQVVDPVFGCFLRAGLSAVIDQLTDCWGERPREVSRLELAGIMLRCVQAGGARIGMRTLGRFVKCMGGDFLT